MRRLWRAAEIFSALTAPRSDESLKKYVRAAFPAGLRESVSKEVLFGALRLETGVLEDRLYTLLERARPQPRLGPRAALRSAFLTARRALRAQDCTGVVCLEDVLRTLAAAAAGDTLRVTRRIVRRGTVEALPPVPLPATAWDENDAAGLVDNLRANFAFDLCVPFIRRAIMHSATMRADSPAPAQLRPRRQRQPER